MEIVQVVGGRKGRFDQSYMWDLESMINLITVGNCFDIMQWTPTTCILTSSQSHILEYITVERAQDGGQGYKFWSSSAADYLCASFSPSLKWNGFGKRSLRSLQFWYFIFCDSTSHACQKHLIFLKLLMPAFQLECIQELVSMGCWEQQDLASPGLDMSSVNCWQWAIPPKRLPW